MGAPHMIVGDLECKKLTVQDSYTYTGNHAVVGNQTVSGTDTVTGVLAANGGITGTTATLTGAVSFGLGQTRRVFMVPMTKQDSATAGTLAESYFIVPKKSKLVKFGIMSAASDIVCSTTTTFELRTAAGAKVATFVTGSLVLGSGKATGDAPETATYLVRNVPYRACVGTDVADKGSVYYFVDVQPVGA